MAFQGICCVKFCWRIACWKMKTIAFLFIWSVFDLCTQLLLDLVSWNILFNDCIFLFSQILYPKMGLGSDIALLCFFWCFVPLKQNNYCLIWFIIWASYSLSTCQTWTLAYVSLFFKHMFLFVYLHFALFSLWS